MIFTSESVTAGHPDKLCDQISDTAIDAFLRQDAQSRAVVECAVATGILFIAARYASGAPIDLPNLAREVIAAAGYLDGDFDARKCSILTSLTELAGGNNGSQPSVPSEHANVFGFACRDTDFLMPAPIVLAHRAAMALDTERHAACPWLAPDAKVQVAVEYDRGSARRVHSVSLHVSARNGEMTSARIAETQEIVGAALSRSSLRPDEKTSFRINPSDSVVLGGPAHHAGLTGRKNGIDLYGDFARQGAAALSGKDPSRIDRTGAYAARHAAKNLVAAGLADRCEVHLGFEIGLAEPVSVTIETFGTGACSDTELAQMVIAHFDFRPAAIEGRFALRARPSMDETGFYRKLAIYGHVGRPELDLPWEKLDMVEALGG